MSDIEETAKATQEVAKTTNTALGVTKDFGKYMSQFFTPPLEQVSALITDKLKYYTWNNKIDLMKKAQNKMESLGYNKPLKTIPLKLGIPMLESASLEDDKILQNLWANLLVNSSTNFSLKRSYISVLEQLSRLEAEIIIEIYSKINYDGVDSYRIEIENYPQIKVIKNENPIPTNDEVEELWNNLGNDKIIEEKIYEPINRETKDMSIELKLALSNLIRLQCIDKLPLIGGGEIFSSISPTLFGSKLYKAVREPIR